MSLPNSVNDSTEEVDPQGQSVTAGAMEEEACKERAQTSSQLISCDCAVHKLLSPNRPRDDKSILLLLEGGRPKPNTPPEVHPRARPKIYKWYDMVTWLAGCKKIQGLFCWPCLIFRHAVSDWNTVGVEDFSLLITLCKRHELTEGHISASLQLANLLARYSAPWKKDPYKYDKEVRKNREAAKDVLEVVGALLGLSETLDTQTLLRLAKQTATTLGAPSDLFLVCQFVLAESLLDIVKEELRSSPVCVIIDQVDKERLAVTLRFSTEKGEVLERFIGFQDYNILSLLVLEIVTEYQIGGKVALVCLGRYSLANGAPPKFGHLYLHSSAHNMSTILCSVFDHIEECAAFFHTVKTFSTWVIEPQIETELLKKLPHVTTAKWRDRIIEAMYENRSALMIFFGEIIENSASWDDDLVAAAHAFFPCFENLEFNFLLFVFNDLFPLADSLLNVLLNRAYDNKFCTTTLKEYQTVLNWKKKKFNELWASVRETVIHLEEKPMNKKAKRSNTRLEDYYKGIYGTIIDYLSFQFKVRFQDLRLLQYLEMSGPQYDKEGIERTAFSMTKMYDHVDSCKLRGELFMLNNRSDFPQKNPESILQLLSASGGDKVMNNASLLYRLLVAVPYPYKVSHESSVRFHQNIFKLASRDDLNPKEEVLLAQTGFLNSVLHTDSFLDKAVNSMAKHYPNISLMPSHTLKAKPTIATRNTL